MSITALPSTMLSDSDPTAITTSSLSQPGPSAQLQVSSTPDPWQSVSRSWPLKTSPRAVEPSTGAGDASVSGAQKNGQLLHTRQERSTQLNDSGEVRATRDLEYVAPVKVTPADPAPVHKYFETKPARSNPEQYKFIMDSLYKARDDAKAALYGIDAQTNGENLLSENLKSELKKIYGNDILSPKNLSLLKGMYREALGGLNYLIKNEENGKSVIFLGDVNKLNKNFKEGESGVAMTPSYGKEHRETFGFIILDRDKIKGGSSYNLSNTLIHEAMHLNALIGKGDDWSDKYKPRGKTTGDALKNAQSTADGIEVFADAVEQQYGPPNLFPRDSGGPGGAPTGFQSAADATGASWATQGQFFQYGQPVDGNRHRRQFKFPDGSRVVVSAHEPLLTNSDGSNFAQFLTVTGSTVGGALAGGAAGFVAGGPAGALIGGIAGAGGGAGAGITAAQSYPSDRIWQGYRLQYYKKGSTEPFFTQYMYAWDSDSNRVQALSGIKDPQKWPDYANFRPDGNWAWWKWQSGSVPPLRT